jgi:hypothetical protein
MVGGPPACRGDIDEFISLFLSETDTLGKQTLCEPSLTGITEAHTDLAIAQIEELIARKEAVGAVLVYIGRDF